MWPIFNQLFRYGKKADLHTLEEKAESYRERIPVPGLWLLGKTGSGKSSIVRYLTNSPGDELVGNGYQPHTDATYVYRFPEDEQPLMRFFDTRGLGEHRYDPHQDLKRLNDETQMVIVVIRATDSALESVISPLRSIREEAPTRPILLAVTCLHEAASRIDLSEIEDPFALIEGHVGANDEDAVATNATIVPPRDRLPAELRPLPLWSLLRQKEQLFEGLVDRMVAIDLTPAKEGFADPNYGGRWLKSAILQSLPHSYRHALAALPAGTTEYESKLRRRSQHQTLLSASAAATLAAVPVPMVDIPGVLAVQTHLAYKIAEIYGQEITPSNWAAVSSIAGGRIAIRLALRELLKVIPLFGIGISAAASFAFTYALGATWDWYFASVRGGRVPPVEQLKQEFAVQLRRAHTLFYQDHP